MVRLPTGIPARSRCATLRRNDPRVPWTEGQQMVDALQKRGATVQWKVYDDEGHGVSKLKNRLELYPLVADFLDKYMK